MKGYTPEVNSLDVQPPKFGTFGEQRAESKSTPCSPALFDELLEDVLLQKRHTEVRKSAR